MSIKTLSPYLITIPLVNPITGVVCFQFTVKLYVWNGEREAVPTEPVYSITKINAAGSSGSDRIDISKLINDDLEFGCDPQASTTVLPGNNQVWVKYEVYYDDLPDISPVNEVELAVKGYGYTMEGRNPQLPVNNILLTGNDFMVSRKGVFALPFMVEQPGNEKVITITNFERIKTNVYFINVSANFSYTELHVFVRTVGVSTWTEITQSQGVYTVPESIAGGIFEVLAIATEAGTGTEIESQVYTITVIKITKIVPSDYGHSTTVYNHSNVMISAFKIEALGFSGPGWSEVPSSGTGPTYISWTPTGDFTIRIKVNNTWYSNEVELTIPLLETIIIP